MLHLGEILSVSEDSSSKRELDISVIDDNDKSIHHFKMTENQLESMVGDSKYGKLFMMQDDFYTGFPVMYDSESNIIKPNENL